MRGQAMGGIANVAPKDERPILVPKRQPPLPITIFVMLVAQEDNEEQERALVLIEVFHKHRKPPNCVYPHPFFNYLCMCV